MRLFDHIPRWRYDTVPLSDESPPKEQEDCLAVTGEGPTVDSLYKSGRRRPKIPWLPILLAILLAANAVALFAILHVLRRSNNSQAPIIQTSSDSFFGHIPVRQTRWHPDESFTSTDPWDGAYWNNSTASKGFTPWDDMFRSAWISVDQPKSYGLSGGVPLRHFAPLNFKDAWSESSEGYVPTVIHQLHCVGIIKHLLEIQRGQRSGSDQGDYGSIDHLLEHGDHCVEYFRHSFMCAADLTLEPPVSVDIQDRQVHGTDGWGATHTCRDWDVVHDKIWAKLIKFVHMGTFGMVVMPDVD